MSEIVRVRLDLAYDGTEFRGFADQGDALPTVARSLRVVLTRRLRGFSPSLTCAGRTDAGVHARGQVVTFDVAEELLPIDLERFRSSCNKSMAPAIVVTAMRLVSPDFDARFSALCRHYRYSVLTTPEADPLRTRTAWWVPDALDLDVMNDAARLTIGEHDFSAFCRRPTADATLVRRIAAAGWRRDHDMAYFDVVANAFCHQMVRSLVGALVDTGRGRSPAEHVSVLLQASDRSAGPALAPPAGLCLERVIYPGDDPGASAW